MVDNGILLYTIVEAISHLNINKKRAKMTASKVNPTSTGASIQTMSQIESISYENQSVHVILCLI